MSVLRVEDWQPLPRATQELRPSLWIGGWGDKQIARSVRFSDAWVPGVVADLQAVEDRKVKQREHVEQTDQDWESMDHLLMREAVIAETEEAVMERKEYLHRTYVDEYGGEFLHPLMAADSVEDFEELAADRFIYGTPERIVEQIKDMRDRFALDQLSLRFHHSGISKDLVEEQIRLFGEDAVLEIGNLYWVWGDGGVCAFTRIKLATILWYSIIMGMIGPVVDNNREKTR